ncbi:ECF transporter S component [Lachnoclostridium sp. Marseille-P6806]|uniref:ECF transporter S component n=1 Tax=Lachnoclostridium sp. Marseille-P6806 TaxID=2364793 RepID=UPI001A92E4CF
MTDIHSTQGSNPSGRGGTQAAGRTRYMAVTGVLTAIALVLQAIEFPLPMLMPPFIKFDLSDLPALIGAFAMGPLCGVIIELLKNLLHGLMMSQSVGVGELCNFLLGAVFVGVSGAIYRRHRSKKTALIASLAGAASMAVLSLPINYFIVYPFYYQFMPEEAILQAYQLILPSVKSILQSLVIFNLPFTFAKGMVDVLITFLIYKRISPLLKGHA